MLHRQPFGPNQVTTGQKSLAGRGRPELHHDANRASARPSGKCRLTSSSARRAPMFRWGGRRMRTRHLIFVAVAGSASVGCATLTLVNAIGDHTIGIRYESAGRSDNVLTITYSSRCWDWLRKNERAHRHWAICNLTLVRWVRPTDRYEYTQACVARGAGALPADVQKAYLEVAVPTRYLSSREEIAAAVERAAGHALLQGDFRFIELVSREPDGSSGLRVAHMHAPPALCPSASMNALSVAAFPGAILFDAVTIPGQLVFALMLRGMH